MDLAAATTRSVTVTASDLSGNAAAPVDGVHAAAIRCGGRHVKVVTSGSATTLTVNFIADAPDDSAARELGQSVLDAVVSENFSWSVAVLAPVRA